MIGAVGCSGDVPADDPLLIRLRELYDSVAEEPVPAALQALVDRLKS
jgi:hypothetical protein